MAQRLHMFGGPLPSESDKRSERIARKRAERPSIDQRFATFHKENPHVLDGMLRLARAKLARGETRIAVKALWEELRVLLASEGPDRGHPTFTREYKLNNDFTALYARTLIRHAPELTAVIELRKRKAKR